MLRAELGPDAPLVTGDSFLSGEFPHEPGSPGTSSCGAQQGSPIAAACFAVVTRDIFMAADSHLCSVESPLGAARFSHDDGFLCSPDPGRVHTSFATLCSALHSINLEVQVAKCKAVFPPGVDPPAGIPSCPGLILHGIPAMGSATFCSSALALSLTRILTIFERVTDRLAGAHALHALWTVTRLSLAHMWDFTTAHCTPTETAHGSAQVDHALLKIVELILDSPLTGSDSLAHADLVVRRIRLPIRLRERIAMAHLRSSAELLLNRIEHLTLPSSQRKEHRDHRYNYSSSWHSAFDHLHQAHSHAERTRAARGSFFTRTF